MTIIRVGATKKYSDGWEAAFGGSQGKRKAAPAKKTKKAASAKKKPAKKAAKARKGK